MSKSELPLLIDVKTFCAHYGGGRMLFYRLVNREDVPTIHIGKRIFLDRVLFDAWLHEQASKNEKCV